MGCMDKGRIYGIGNTASSLSTDGSFNNTSSSSAPPLMTPDQPTEPVSKVIWENFDDSIRMALESRLPNLFETLLIQLRSSCASNHAGRKGNGSGDNNGNAEKQKENEKDSKNGNVDENKNEKEHERNSVNEPVNFNSDGVAFQLKDEDPTFLLF